MPWFPEFTSAVELARRQTRAAGRADPVTQYFTALGQDQRLHAGFKALRAAPGFDAYPPARKRHVENELRDFRLGGAELPPPEKARFREIQEELARLASRFQDNLLDATNAFAHYVKDEKELSGIPQDVLDTAREAARKEGREGWKLVLHMPCYMPVMQYADHHGLRETMYRAFVTRSSERRALRAIDRRSSTTSRRSLSRRASTIRSRKTA